jgi:hypothetical protein
MPDDEIPPLPEDWLEKLAEIGRVNGLGALAIIRDILAEQPRTDFHFALGRIMERLREETNVLVQDGPIATIPQIAWATRNIIELRIWSRFICQSNSNVSRFVHDLSTVAASTMRAQLRLLNDLADKVPRPVRPTSEQYRQVAAMQESRTELGVNDEGPLMARTYAKTVGLEKEYVALSSVTSPLIHPSAVSVLRSFNIEAYRDSLRSHGLFNGTQLILDARKHIETYGFKPAK